MPSKRIRFSSKLNSVQGVDKTLLVFILILTLTGLLAVADASAPQALKFFNDRLYFFKQQVMWAFVGLFALIITANIKYTFWEKAATFLFAINLLLLLLVLIPGIGLSVLGARRWIVLGPVNFQPSEIIKITLALYLAKVASREKGAPSYFLPVVIATLLIMIQPDLGTTLVISFIAFVQIFASGLNLVYFGAAGSVAFFSALFLIFTSDYRRARLQAFLESASDPLGNTYHIRQILLALGSGGILGVGLGRSRQKYLFLPESATDSIFAVIAEELGFLGGAVLIALFVFLTFRCIRLATRAPDRFSQITVIGITAWIAGQAFLNIASMTALVPLTGIPLPFISYGGTALTTLMAAAGILLNISKYAKR